MRRDNLRGLALFELQITGVIIGVITVAAILVNDGKRSRPLDCLRNLAAGRADALCPVSGTPSVIEGLERRCNDPNHHLKTDPRIGAGVSQTLPAADAGRADRVAVGALRWGHVRTVDDRRVLEIQPRAWWRWALSPLLQLLALVYFVLAAVSFVGFLGSPREKRIRNGGCANTLNFVCHAGGAVLCAWLFWCAFSSGWGRETITVGPDAVEHRTFAAGIDLGAQRWPNPIAIVPAGAAWAVIYVDGDRRQVGSLGFIGDDDLNGVACMNEALHARP